MIPKDICKRHMALKETDVILGRLSVDQMKTKEDMDNAAESYAMFAMRAEEQKQKAMALSTMLFSSIKEMSEQASTAQFRDKELGIRVNAEGEYVFVEFPANEMNLANGLQDLLRSMLGK